MLSEIFDDDRFADVTIRRCEDGKYRVEYKDTLYPGKAYLDNARFDSYEQAFMVAQSIGARKQITGYRKLILIMFFALVVSVVCDLDFLFEMFL